MPSKRPPTQRNSSQPQQAMTASSAADIWLSDRPRQLLLAGTAALWVAMPLLPSEAVARQGTHTILVMLWMLLWATYSLWSYATRQLARPLGWAEGLGLAVIGWHTLSGLVMLREGNPRASLHVIWLWLAYAVGAYLIRQLVQTERESRALATLFLGLAIALATQGLYQYGVAFPQLRAKFRENPQLICRENGINPDPLSSSFQQFKNRIESREPLGTFALTNSLAGYLAPWLVMVIGLGMVGGKVGCRQIRTTAAAVAILLLACLVLTKSRTGVLAAGVGTVLLLLYGRLGGVKIGWKLPLAATLVLLVVGIAALLLGGLDVQVLSEAPKSLLYRLEYWQSTASMIGQHPLFGVGPGNFQDYYAQYKLPQASEMVADPHNAIFELWATAGTPAVLLLCAAAVLGVKRLLAVIPTQAEAEEELPADAVPASAIGFLIRDGGLIDGGGLLGVLLAYGLAAMLGFPLSSEYLGGHVGLLLLGLPLAAVAIVALQPWVRNGAWPMSHGVIALITLEVNLLMAGALAFPGVMLTGWVVLGLISGRLARACPEGEQDLPNRRLTLVLVSLAAVVGCFLTEYRPTLVGAGLLSEGLERLQDPRTFPLAKPRLEAAMAADPWSPEIRQTYADCLLKNWLQDSTPQRWEEFVRAAEDFQRLNSHSRSGHLQRMEWFLQAYRYSERSEHLDLAIQAAEQVIAHDPSRSLPRAQQAWLKYLSGDLSGSKVAAAESLRLDGLCPHQDQKLATAKIYDPHPSTNHRREFLDVTALETAQRLAEQHSTGDSPKTK